MWRTVISTSLCLVTALYLATARPQLQGTVGDLNFQCPERNGFFPDREMCDVFYECRDNVPTGKLCEDGLLYNDTNPNCGDRCCDYPFNVDCKTREFVQEPQSNKDPRCYRANGYFNHIDETVCDKFYQCVHGTPNELPCPRGLIFDEAQGTCVHPEQASSFARQCDPAEVEEKNVGGFTCPTGDTLGPHGQALAHPTFPHPTDCQKYIICFFGETINERGCEENQVFDTVTSRCVAPEDGPDDCKCWWGCTEECPYNAPCNTDCSCPSVPAPASQGGALGRF